MAKGFSRKEKNEITKKWNDLFPTMGVYKDMWLIQIIGPVAVGLRLEIGSNRDLYKPILHIHDLAEDDEVVTLVGAIDAGYDYISTKSDSQKYLRLAEILKEKSIISLVDNLESEEFINQLFLYAKKCSSDDRIFVLKMCLRAAIWFEKKELMESAMRFLKNELGNFTEFFPEEKSVLQKKVKENISKLKMESLPNKIL